MNFTAIDFETANQTRASVCAIGLVRVEDGVVKKRVHQLIRPDSPFNYACTMVHGIRAFDVRNSPTFPEFWEEIRDYFSDNVVCHNASFDISCLRESLKFYGLDFPQFYYLCTLQISRKINTLPSHSLDSLARHFGVTLNHHHNALEDANACARLFEIFANRADVLQFKKSFCACIPEKKSSPRKTVKRTRPVIENPEWKSAESFIEELERTQKSQSIQRANNLRAQINDLPFEYGSIDFSKNFVVAGRFRDISRGDVEGLIMRLGGTISRQVCADIDYIVVGSKRQIDCPSYEYGEAIDKALSLGLTFISEDHFLRNCY